MKKANKVILGVAALLTAFSVCTLTACGGEQTEAGTIAGDYQEATSEDVTTALSKIESDKMTGDTTAADYKFGLEVSAELNADLDLGSQGKTKAELKVNYKELATKDTTTGAGELSAKTEMTSTVNNETKTDKMDMSLKMYNDAKYAYVDAKADDHNEETKEDLALTCKVDYTDIVSTIMGSLPFALANDAGQAPADAPSQTPAESDVLATLNELGVKTYVDNKDGVKLKFSVTEETVWKVMALSGEVTEETITTLKKTVTFNAFKLDAYFAIDKDGVFSGASVDVNIDAKYDMNALIPDAAKAESAEKLDVYTAKVSGYFKVSAYTNEAPVIPEGIATDAKYTDMTATVKETIGSLIGGQLPSNN